MGGGTLDGEYVVCPWHYWAFHRQTGVGGLNPSNAVPAHEVRVVNGRVLIASQPHSERTRPPRLCGLGAPSFRAERKVRVPVGTTGLRCHPK